MKRFFALSFCLLLTLSQAHADILMDALKEVIEDKLTSTVGKHLENSWDGNQYWGQLIGNIAKGTPEVVVAEIIDEFSMESIAKDTGMKLLEFLVPEAAGPIGVLLKANEAVYAYVNYMTDFYKQQHMQLFVSKVIEPSKTSAELRSNYATFKAEVIDMGGVDRNIFYNDRAAQEEEFYNAFLRRLADLVRYEKAMAERKNAQKIISQKFKAVRSSALAEVRVAQDYLTAAQMEVSVAAIQRFRKDPDFAGSVREAARKAGQKPATPPPGAKPPTPPNETTKPKTPVTPVVPPPAQPGGGPIGKSLQLRNAGVNSENQRIVDYSVFYNAYKDLANQLTFGDLPGTVFSDASTNIRAGAREAFSNCLAAGSDQQDKECVSGHQRFERDAGQIDANLAELSAKILADLDARKKRMMAMPTPKSQWEVLAQPLYPDIEKAKSGGPCGVFIGGLTVKQAQEKIDACASFIGFVETLVNTIDVKTREYQVFAKAYDEKLASEYAAYVEAFGKDYNLAVYGGGQLESYFYKTLGEESARMEQYQTSDMSPLGDGILNELRRRVSSMTRTNRAALEQVTLSAAFINALTPAREAVEKAFVVALPSGNPIDLRTFDGTAYYNTQFRDLFTNFFSGALGLLSPHTKGYDPAESMPFKDGNMRVWDAPGKPFYLSVSAHEATLKDFSEKVAALKAFDLEKRHGVMDAAVKKAEAEVAKVQSKTADANELWQFFENAKRTRDAVAWHVRSVPLFALFYGQEYSLSLPLMESVREDYAAKIGEIKAREQNMIKVFNKYTTAAPKDAQGNYPRELLDARTDMNCKKWECSAGVWQAYRAMGDALDANFLEELKTFRPLKGLRVNGTDVPQNASKSIELSDKDLVNGEIEMVGELQPGTLGVVKAIAISLDGQSYTQSLPPSESFRYAFKPKAGERYTLSVRVERRDDRQVVPWPAQGDYFTVEYGGPGSSAEVAAFYETFRQAYEDRNAPRVMSLIDDAWSAGDGTDLQDLEDNLSSNFRLYDEIHYAMTGLKATRRGGVWDACYDATITSRLFKRNLKHEEKSSVCDQLAAPSGSLKIMKTTSGTYWYVK